MKSVLKKCLVIAMMLTVLTTIASTTDNSIRFTVINSKLIDLKFMNSDGDVVISVKDINGEVLYSENYNGTSFSKKYNLAILPNGNYFFEIEGHTKIKLMNFEVSSNNVSFDNKIETIYYKPTVRRDEDFVYVSKINFKENEALSIALYDEKFNVIYSEDINELMSLGKVLNISKLEEGNYKLVLRMGGRIFTEEIIK